MNRKDNALTENEVFEKASFGKKNPLQGVYEECRFLHCDLAHSDLSGVVFRNCTFENCDLSLVKLHDTGFQEVRFETCKLLGLPFCDCRPLLLEFEFEGCLLKLSVFQRLVVRNTRFTDCDLQEADFTAADLTGSAFINCDLTRTTFERTNLEKADFRTAFNYSINPETNRIRKARFSLAGIAGLLDAYDIEIE